MTDDELAAIRLRAIDAHDALEDIRPALLALLAEVERLRAELAREQRNFESEHQHAHQLASEVVRLRTIERRYDGSQAADAWQTYLDAMLTDEPG